MAYPDIDSSHDISKEVLGEVCSHSSDSDDDSVHYCYDCNDFTYASHAAGFDEIGLAVKCLSDACLRIAIINCLEELTAETTDKVLLE